MPLYSLSVQSSATMPGVDQAGHVGLEREVDDVGRLAGLDRARLVAGGAERVLRTRRPRRPEVSLKPGSSVSV